MLACTPHAAESSSYLHWNLQRSAGTTAFGAAPIIGSVSKVTLAADNDGKLHEHEHKRPARQKGSNCHAQPDGESSPLQKYTCICLTNNVLSARHRTRKPPSRFTATSNPSTCHHHSRTSHQQSSACGDNSCACAHQYSCACHKPPYASSHGNWHTLTFSHSCCHASNCQRGTGAASLHPVRGSQQLRLLRPLRRQCLDQCGLPRRPNLRP